MWTVPCKTTAGPPRLASPATLGVSVQLDRKVGLSSEVKPEGKALTLGVKEQGTVVRLRRQPACPRGSYRCVERSRGTQTPRGLSCWTTGCLSLLRGSRTNIPVHCPFPQAWWSHP